MTQFDTISLETAKTHLTERRRRRKLSPEREAERIAKMKATKASKRAEQEAKEAALPTILALREEVAELRNTISDLQHAREHERTKAAKLQDNLTALHNLEGDARAELHRFMETVRGQDKQLNALQAQVTELRDRWQAAKHQRDALQSTVLIHSTRSGAREGVVSLLLAALTVVGDTLGYCSWCGTHRADDNDDGTEPHTDNCVVGRALENAAPSLSEW
jgi:chromosome segregation ATPase